MTERPGIAAVVLAAGGSARFGSPKQLVAYRGEPLVRHAVLQALGACHPVHVVVGAAGDQVTRALDGLPVEIVVNERWHEGLGGSVACGVEAALASANLEAVLLTLADLPLVRVHHLLSMIDRYRAAGASVVAARHGGGLGVPAIFGASVATQLTSLHGDQGARRVIAALGSDAVGFELPEAARDIDLASDYEALTST